MNDTPQDPASNTGDIGGVKTRKKLKFLDGLSAMAVLLLVLEFWVFSVHPYSAIALWLLVLVILVSQILKLRISCPACGHSVYRSWHYSYRAKVPDKCSNCGKALP